VTIPPSFVKCLSLFTSNFSLFHKIIVYRFSLKSCICSSDRLVECSALKRAIEIVYAATLPKASKPFIYISIVLPPENMDVNLHPTKGEVKA